MMQVCSGERGERGFAPSRSETQKNPKKKEPDDEKNHSR